MHKHRAQFRLDAPLVRRCFGDFDPQADCAETRKIRDADDQEAVNE